MSCDDRELEGKAIYITGSRHLDNQALACFLTQATGARCEAVSFDDVEAMSCQIPPPEPRLFLFDALDRRIQAMIIDDQPGMKGNKPLFAGLFSRLFQEYFTGNGQGKAMNGRPCGFIYRCDLSDLFLLAIRDLLLGRKSVMEGLPVLFTRPGKRPRSQGAAPPQPQRVSHPVHDGRRLQQQGHCRTAQYQQPHRSNSSVQYLSQDRRQEPGTGFPVGP